MPVNKRNPPEKQNRIQDEMKNSRKKALELSKTHIDVKPIKYLIKN